MPRNVRGAGMVLGGLGALSPNSSAEEVAEIISVYARAGIRSFLFPGRLAQTPDLLSSLVLRARRTAEAAGFGKVLIALGGDSYPGFGLPFLPDLPTSLSLASLASPAAARRAGSYLGLVLSACGVDLVLGPRLDLASDPKDPVGAIASFGEDSRLAGLLGSAFARGLSRSGVAACIGRFPGLGTTCRDSYGGMAFIALPVERLEHCEMRPFAGAVRAGVAAVLVGRVLVPSLESEHIPASSSARVIEGRLRESMGFRGLVIGDDIGPGEDPGRASILGALAGCDLCLFAEPKEALAAAAALEKAMAAGELPAIRVETARRRLERLMRARPVSARRRPFASAAILRREARDIGRGTSLLRGSLVLGEAESGDFRRTLVLVFIPPESAPDASESASVLAALKAELPGAELLSIPADPEAKHTEELARVLGSGERFAEAVIFTYDAHFRPAQESLARLVEESIPDFRVIAMRDPYDAAFFPGAVGLGAAYGFSECCARAAARVLSGKEKARGGRPVEVIGLEV